MGMGGEQEFLLVSIETECEKALILSKNLNGGQFLKLHNNLKRGMFIT
jgi:hypothetical protein